MRVAILSDIHGYLISLDAVLQDLDAGGPFDHIVVAGDLCVFGPRPKEVLDRLRELPCEIVQGNTDLWLVDSGSLPGDEKARDAAEWTKAKLDDDDLSLIRELSFSYEVTPAPGHSLLTVHANPHDLVAMITAETDIGELTRLTENVMAEVLVFGHIHIPFVRKAGGLTLANVGSVGIPLDGDTRSSYATFEWDGNQWTISHHRVEYDLEATVKDMREQHMPYVKDRIKVLRDASRP